METPTLQRIANSRQISSCSEQLGRPSEFRINFSTSLIPDDDETKSLSNTFLLKALLMLS